MVYKKIKKEHLFIFLALFTTLVLFTYFEEFEYTGLTTKGICEEQGYQCCEQGEGTNYFSMDYSCSNNQQCWSSCIKEQENLITTNAFIDPVWNPIKNFFTKLFNKKVKGKLVSGCGNGEEELFTVSEGHASSGSDYPNKICSTLFKVGGDYILIKLSNNGTDSHVQKEGSYPISIKIKPKTGEGTIECTWKEVETCNEEEVSLEGIVSDEDENTELLFSVNDLTDAHVGGQNEFDIKVCCEVTGRRNTNGGDDSQLPPLTQSDYEVYWANDKVIAFSFNKYIQRITQTQLQNIKEFKVYRSTDRTNFDLITTLEKLSTNQNDKVIKDYRGSGNEPTANSYEDSKYDFWDDYNTLTDGTTYHYKLVPTNNEEIESNENSIISIPLKATNTAPSDFSSRTCNNIPYSECSSEKPNYCGYGDNELNNNGFELELNNWQVKGSLFDIEETINHNGKTSKVAHVNVQNNHNSDIGLYQQINVDSNTHYRISAYIKTARTSSIKPLLYVSCSTESLSDGKERKFLTSLNSLVADRRPNTIIEGGTWKEYSYIFKTYEGADKCNIYPVFLPKDSKGEIWIDGVRVEKLEGSSIDTTDDCGICGCPTREFCSLDGACSEEPPVELIETDCNNGRDDDYDGIIDEFDSDCINEEDAKFIALKPSRTNQEGIFEFDVSNDEPYINSKIMADCQYNVFDSDYEQVTINQNIITRSLKCIKLLKDDEELKCDDKRFTPSSSGGIYNAKFINCNVGSQIGEKELTCQIDENCNHGSPSGDEEWASLLTKQIEVKEFNYCSEGNQGTYLTMESSTDDDDYEAGETIEIISTINYFGDRSNIIVKSALIDLNTGERIKEIKEASSTEKIMNSMDEEDFNVNLLISSFNANSYALYIKSYVVGDEDSTCRQEVKNILIEIPDDDDESNFEICDDGFDNDNDGLTDCDDDCSLDPACREEIECNEENEGETKICDTGLFGICGSGIQTCTNNEWGFCIQTNQEQQEICNDGLDNNCNDRTDEGCAPQRESGDSDNDGLPDTWERQHFNNLYQGPNDDYDNDGISNINEYISDTNPTVSDEEKGLLWLWITIGIILVIVIFFFVFKLLKKPKVGRGSSSYTNPQLKSYVQSSLRKGFTKHQIKQALSTKGWSSSDIDKALR